MIIKKYFSIKFEIFFLKNDNQLYEKIVWLKLKVDDIINSDKKEIERKLKKPTVTSENYIKLTEDNNLKLPNW